MNIRLDKNSLIIEKTYISLANQRILTIHNRSNIIAHFQWKTFATQEEEDREKYRFVGKITYLLILVMKIWLWKISDFCHQFLINLNTVKFL